MKLMPYIDAWKKQNPHVTVAKVDATKWEVDAFRRFLPATPELPAVDIYGPDKKLIIRLSGMAVFNFRDHLPKGVDKGYPEGWTPPADKKKSAEKAAPAEKAEPAEAAATETKAEAPAEPGN
jgi:hypothetical protein